MKVINQALFPVIAVFWHKTHGFGEEVEIPSGGYSDLKGPYIGDMGNGNCHLALDDKIFSSGYDYK